MFIRRVPALSRLRGRPCHHPMLHAGKSFLRFLLCSSLCLAFIATLADPVLAGPLPGPGDTAPGRIDLNAKPQLNPSIQAIRDSGVLRIGIAYPDNLPMYGHDNEGNLIGYDIDLARGMAQALQVEPIFNQPKVTYNRLIQLASADQVDVAIGKLSVTIPRLGYAKPVPYLNLHQSLLINRKVLDRISKDPDNIGPSLRTAPLRIGVISGSSHAVWGSTTFPKASFTTFPDWQTCVDALINREVDALFRDGFETSRIVKSKPRLALDYVPIILKDKIDNIAMYVGPRMEGLLPVAGLYINISTGVINEEDLFRRFKKEMRDSPVAMGKTNKVHDQAKH